MSQVSRFAEVRFHSQVGAPLIKPIRSWPSGNQRFYSDFRAWLREGGYSENAITLYSVAARLALGLLDRSYWMIDPDADLAQVRNYLTEYYPSQGTRAAYHKGLSKLAQYLRLRTRRPQLPKSINWNTYCPSFPAWLVQDIQAYIAYRQRGWRPQDRHEWGQNEASHLTLFLRWMMKQTTITTLEDITPQWWFEYADTRLAADIKPKTLNGELRCLKHFLHFLLDQARPICSRMLRVERFDTGPTLPRDVPADHLSRLREQIETDATSPRADLRRMGLMDRAWFLLMLHSGLRTGEVRRLRLGDLDLTARRARIEQSKGLKDRIVYLSQPTVEAIQAYRDVRGPANTDHLFLFRHRPLSDSYCHHRLRIYGKRCGLRITPHQLRHSCATLLLNAGAPILTVQSLLGHKFIDTTLNYARLYDGTIANDFYRAMTNIESRFDLDESPAKPPANPAQILAMVDALQSGTLNDRQRETVQTLRDAILTLATSEPGLSDEATLVIESMTKKEAA